MWQTTDLVNESDVEQKFLYRFFTEPHPQGMGLPDSVIQTKANVRRFSIGKGSEQKLYFPDYLIVMLGYPLVVIEAKGPGESVEEGYRQARLYSHELNSLFPTGFNPCKYVIASNGIDLWYGLSDQSQPLAKPLVASLGVYSSDVAKLHELIAWQRLEIYATSLAQSAKAPAYFKPRRMVGGIDTQNEEAGRNTFGATLTATVSHIFNPTSREEKKFIARNGVSG